METTFYSFQSNIRYFLSSLLKDPIKAQPSDFLKERGFDKKKLINILLKRDVIKRHEKIDDNDEKVNYKVKYNVVRDKFERKLKRIYNKYFENNSDHNSTGEDEKILQIFNKIDDGDRIIATKCGNEVKVSEVDADAEEVIKIDSENNNDEFELEFSDEDEGSEDNEEIVDEATACCGGGAGAENTASGPYVGKALFSTPMEKEIKIESVNKKSRNIYITEKQFEVLKEALGTCNAGDYQYTVPFPVKKNDPTMKRGKKGESISMKRLKK